MKPTEIVHLLIVMSVTAAVPVVLIFAYGAWKMFSTANAMRREIIAKTERRDRLNRMRYWTMRRVRPLGIKRAPTDDPDGIPHIVVQRVDLHAKFEPLDI